MANKNVASLFTKIDGDLKERMTIYITNSKLTDKKADTQKKLIEEAVHEYLINHPIPNL